LKKIVITGVAGLIGSRMAEWIIANHPSYTIIGIDDLSGGYIEHVPKQVQFHQLDISTGNVSELIKGAEIVYHFAAYAAEGLSPFIRKYNYNCNLVATANIVNACIEHAVGRLVFTSSMAVYGVGTPPFKETDAPSPIDPYGVAKYACEMDIQIAGEQHGLDWCIIRPHNVYGIKQNIWDKYRNVLGIWMHQYLNGEPMTIFGDGEQTRAFSYIDDIVEPLWNAAIRPEASKEIINLGGVEEWSVNKANSLLKSIIGSGEVVYKEGRHEVKNSIPTFQKSIDILGFEHKNNLKLGLTKMWEWAKKQPKREIFSWPSYEIDNGIYSFWKTKNNAKTTD